MLSWQDLRDGLRKLGATPVRVRGSHEQWRFEDGEVFTCVINHLGDNPPPYILCKYKKLKKRRKQAA